MKAQRFVLAIHPTARGYAFVLFDGADSPFDWGDKEFRRAVKNACIVESVSKLVTHYRPRTLVMENPADARPRRSHRVLRLYRALVHLAETESVDVKLYTRCLVRQCFFAVGAATKLEIARAVARQIPALEHRLPPIRKAWMSEDARQSLFDAAALGMTYYSYDGNEDRG